MTELLSIDLAHFPAQSSSSLKVLRSSKRNSMDHGSAVPQASRFASGQSGCCWLVDLAIDLGQAILLISPFFPGLIWTEAPDRIRNKWCQHLFGSYNLFPCISEVRVCTYGIVSIQFSAGNRSVA